MTKIYSLLKRRMALVALALPIFSISAKAITYTAVANGNFNAVATWGGIAPPVISTADLVIIPAGITVTLSADQTFNSTSQLTVNGTLTSGVNASALVMTAGTLAGNGVITVDSMATGLVAGFTYTGTMTVQKLTSLTTTIGTAASITVGNALNVTLGALSIMAGNVTMAANSTIVMNGGTIAVGGTGVVGLANNYNVTYLGATVIPGVELSGTGLHNVTVNLISGAVTLSGSLNVNGLLTLTAGNLVLNGHNLTFGATGDFSPTGLGNISSTLTSNVTINSATSLTGGLRFNAGANTINNLTVNLGAGNVNLGSDLNVNGTMALTTGTLSLNNHDLTFSGNGDFAAMGVGTINATSASNILVTAANSFSGGIRFSPAGNTLRNFIVNMSNNTSNVALGSDLIVNDTLGLTAGRINVAAHNLTVAASGIVNGGAASSYVITSNGGNLIMHLVASATDTFQVGSATNYSPAVIIANAGSVNSDISVMVKDTVFTQGTSGVDAAITRPVVDATWFIGSSAGTGLNLNMQVMWSAAMEVNAFDRMNAFISHYTNSAWDVTATAAATTAVNGMFTISRNNVTSLSPFTVADNNSKLEVGKVATANTVVTIYPNPAANTLNFTSTVSLTGAAIYDVSGRMVKSVSNIDNNSISIADLAPGYYNVRLYGRDNSSVANFIKE